MKHNVYRGEWAGCSNFKERKEELNKAHQEFLELLNEGYKIKSIKPKRPRIKKPIKASFKLWGTIEMDIPEEILIKAGFLR